jgi:glycosyltransferase involved in cell wall biosynthesis
VFFELLGFVLLLLLFDRSLFVLIHEGESFFYGHLSSFSLSEKFSQIRNMEKYKILIFGSSRTYEGIHPKYIQHEFGIKAFKEAFVGKGPMYNYYFYQEYKKRVGIPWVVIYGVDYFMFNETSERHWMQRFDRDLIRNHYFSQGVFMLLANKAYIDIFINNFLTILQKTILGERYFPVEQDNDLMENYLGLAHTGDIDTHAPPKFRRIDFIKYPGKEGVYFSRLMEELHRDQVTVLLLSLPDYVGTYRSNKSQKQFVKAFRKYQEKYDNIHFLNYNGARMFDIHNPEYFIDGGYGKTNSHLSRSGAEILNRMVIDDLRRYLPQHEIQARK